MKNLLVLLVASQFFSSCASSSDQNNEKISVVNLENHIIELSSDEYQGRMPFTEGETKTIAYLENQFKEMGVEPGNGDSYFQDVPLVNITCQAEPEMKIRGKGSNFSLKGFDDYILYSEKPEDTQSLDGSDIVFAGYGIVAPEYNWNDYENIDVKGKVVLVMVNDPGYGTQDENLFKGNTMTYYGRWTYKYEEAARQGAKACLVIHNTAAASYPFSVVQNNWNSPALMLDKRGQDDRLNDMVGWISEPATLKTLKAAGLDSTVFQKANRSDFKSISLGLGASTSLTATYEYNNSKNVIAKVTGSKYPDEYIIYTAHWDHLGIGTPDETGDSIYNGALDNATGTAGLLELARTFRHSDQKPERSIIFLAVTAEEQGLLGSAYYAQNPVYAANKTLANINMDGLNYYGKTEDVIVVGQGQSELEDYLKTALDAQKRVVEYEKHPEAGYYYRSDHFNFAKIGIPALYLENGERVVGQEGDYGKNKNDDFRDNHYHRPSDEYDAKTWVLDGAIEDLTVLYNVGIEISNTAEWPKWKEGSEFKAIREKSL
ncbi:MAG: Zn-dependent M28 family amino/carboxypeptidase [Arcticibacterium sp.]|jgi:Zn-dependent M28 family amino/carboxypeptidase